jgi:hypothetical protein
MLKTLLAALAVLGLLGAAPAPVATPLKTISHQHVSPLCTGLRRNIGPAIGRVLQNDKLIANSRPLFKDFVHNAAIAGSGAQDLAVMRLERLIGPMVKNANEIERLLNDPYIFPKVAVSDSDRQLLAMRQHLREVVAQQKSALDVISGFVDTQQLGELQAAGHQYDSAINGTETQKQASEQSPQQTGAAPTPPPSGVLDAGVKGSLHANDPRFQENGNLVGHNPLDAFGDAIAMYQQDIDSRESQTAKLVMQAVPQCNGGTATPAPQPSMKP